jgi:hypothetical protein
MSNDPDPQDTTDDLQFEVAEPAVVDHARSATAGPTCVGVKEGSWKAAITYILLVIALTAVFAARLLANAGTL